MGSKSLRRGYRMRHYPNIFDDDDRVQKWVAGISPLSRRGHIHSGNHYWTPTLCHELYQVLEIHQLRETQSSFVPLMLTIFCLSLFILRERERERAGEGQRETIPSTDSAEPDVGMELMNHEIMAWAETCLTNWATQMPQWCLQSNERKDFKQIITQLNNILCPIWYSYKPT